MKIMKCREEYMMSKEKKKAKISVSSMKKEERQESNQGQIVR